MESAPVLKDKLHVGLKMSLQLENTYGKIDLILVGWVKDQVIMATSSKLRTIDVTSQAPCVIRFANNGIAYGFYTQMTGKTFSPLPMIFFKYPDNISSLQYRKSARLKTNIPVMIMGLEETQGLISGKAKIVDISDKGCLLEMASENLGTAEKDMDFYLTFKILEESLHLDCTVRNVRKDGKHYLLGTQFKNISNNDKELIKNFQCMFAVSEREVPT